MLTSYNNRELLINDLSNFLNVSHDYATYLVNVPPNNAIGHGMVSVPNLWRWMMNGNNEGTANDHAYYYAICFPYLGDLINFTGQFDFSKAQALQYCRGRVLDFGCGIGTVAIEMMDMPSVDHVDAVDICIPTTEFLKYRARVHNWQKLTVLDSTNTPGNIRSSEKCLTDKYDFIYARDCFEHIHNRVEVLDKLLEHLSDGGVICEASPIANIGPEDGKENIPIKEYDIWNLLEEKGFKKISSEWTGGFSLGHTNCWKK
jgi:SAM-dependent methyltransferase